MLASSWWLEVIWSSDISIIRIDLELPPGSVCHLVVSLYFCWWSTLHIYIYDSLWIYDIYHLVVLWPGVPLPMVALHLCQNFVPVDLSARVHCWARMLRPTLMIYAFQVPLARLFDVHKLHKCMILASTTHLSLPCEAPNSLRMVTISHTDCQKTASLRKVQVVSPASSYLKLGKWFLQCWFFESGPSSWHQNWGPHICKLILCLVDGWLSKVFLHFKRYRCHTAPTALTVPQKQNPDRTIWTFPMVKRKTHRWGDHGRSPWAMQICKVTGQASNPQTCWDWRWNRHASAFGGLRWWIFVCGDSMVGISTTTSASMNFVLKMRTTH